MFIFITLIIITEFTIYEIIEVILMTRFIFLKLSVYSVKFLLYSSYTISNQ